MGSDVGDRVESVQAMRGVAALGVVILHAREAVDRQGFIDHPLGSQTWIGEWANLGAVGVDLFFVISGFVMALTAAGGSPISGTPADPRSDSRGREADDYTCTVSDVCL